MDAAPVLLDLQALQPQLQRRGISSDRFQWHIPILKDTDIVWSLALAYLNSFSLSDEMEIIDQRMECILGKKLGSCKKGYIEYCNVFLYKKAYFFDETIKDLCKKLNECFFSYEDQCALNANRFSRLQACSILLSCKVVLITGTIYGTSIEIDDDARFFLDGSSCTSENKTLIIIHQQKSSNNPAISHDSFSFFISKTLAFEKQKVALQKILTKSKISENEYVMERVITRICLLPDIAENLIISLLLREDLVEYIPFLYKYSYILSKLSYAGFETDPSKNNKDGKSALFYALQKKDSSLLYFLYDYVTNFCLRAQGSIRSLDPVVVTNLINIKPLLNELQMKVHSAGMEEKLKKRSSKNLKELCHFNDFQIDICRAVNKQKEKNCHEAEQRKEIIIHILQNYRKYFEWEDGHSEDEMSRLGLFIEHADYFDNLDFCYGVIFFDNLFLLKERLELPEKSYVDIETRLFFIIYCRKYFERIVNQIPKFYSASRAIIFLERLSLKKSLRSFEKKLMGTPIRIELHNIPEKELKTLTNIPEIYGEFLVLKLKNYLNATLNINEINMKAILIVQRTLQVIGECFTETTFKSIQKLLPLSFQDELVTNLKQIRNLFAHPKDFMFTFRISAEENTELFHKIKYEIFSLKSLLSPIFYVHKCEMNKFDLQLFEKKINAAKRKKISLAHHFNLRTILPQTRTENQNNEASGVEKSWNRYFDDMYILLKSRMDSNNQEEDIITNITVQLYEYITKNLFSAIKNKINHMKNECLSIKKIDIIHDYFESIEYLLIFTILKDKKLDTNLKQKLLSTMDYRPKFFLKFKENIQNDDVSQSQTSVQKLNSGPIQPTEDGTVIATESNDDCAHTEPNKRERCYKDTLVDTVPETSKTSEHIQEKPHAKVAHTEVICSNLKRLKEAKKMEASVEDINFDSELCNIFNGALKKDISHQDGIDKNPGNSAVIETIPNENVVHLTGNPESSINMKVKNEKEIFDEYIENILNEYENITDTFFLEVNDKNIRKYQFNFDNIGKFRKILSGCLSENEKKTILNSIPNDIRSGFQTINKVKYFLEGKSSIQLNKEEFDREISKLPLKEKEIKELSDNFDIKENRPSLLIIKSINNYLQDLENALQNNEIQVRTFKNVCENLKLPEDSREILKKIVLGEKSKVFGNKLEFLLDRIKHLKNILINENQEIKQLWETTKSIRKKEYIQKRLVHVYLSDSGVQASVEMLLFDCMNILKRKDLKILCRKTANLFNGINLRNVLAHGNPFLETLGSLLDPCDFPSELMQKMLGLVNDLKTIECMTEVQNKSGYNYSNFMRIMDDDTNENFKILRETIKRSDNWKQYSKLIPQ